MKKHEFDQVIRKNVEKHDPKADFGYKTSTNEYDIYLSNDCFESFKKAMDPNHLKAYDKGDGGELKPKKGRFGVYPPKMASVASSSRFCYLALRNGGAALGAASNTVFEHKSPVCADLDCFNAEISTPNLDAYFADENIFVEAKCHEIFDSHKVLLSSKYWSLVYGEGNAFGFNAKPADKCPAKEFMIPLSEFGISGKSSMVDTKQLMCHLMGIASQKDTQESAELVYLFFWPIPDSKEDKKKVDKVFKSLKRELAAVFASYPIQTFCRSHSIKLRAVAERSALMEDLTADNVVDLLG